MQINVMEYLENGPLRQCRDKVAIKGADCRYTFAEIERVAKNCAALILKRISTFNQPVAVFLPKSAQAIIANLGILYTGNCYSNLDIKSPPQRLKSMLQNLGGGLIISSEPCLKVLRSLDVPEERILLLEEALTATANYDNAALLARLDQVIDTLLEAERQEQNDDGRLYGAHLWVSLIDGGGASRPGPRRVSSSPGCWGGCR